MEDNTIATLQNELDFALDYNFKVYIGKNEPFVSKIINDFISKEGKNIDISLVFNTGLYDWYFGTIIHKLLIYVFQPYLIFKTFPKTEDKYKHMLSKLQIQDILNVIHKLIINNNVELNLLDVYDDTAFDYITKFTKNNIIIPDILKEYIPAFKFVLRNGKNAINIQQKIVRAWYLKRKQAVLTIENSFLELILNPDSELGKKKITNLSKIFRLLMST
jgi:hypothetical protein